MKNSLPDVSISQAAIITGIAIVVMTFAAAISTDVTIGSLVVSSDPQATFENIKNEPLIFRIGVISWMVILICDVFAAWGLYIILRPVNQSISLLAAWLRIVYTAILGTAILNFVYVLQLIDPENYFGAIGQEHLESQIWIYLNNFDAAWSIGLIVFGLHIFLLGFLGLKSKYIPRLIAIFLILGFIGYVMINASKLLFPQFQNLIQILEWIFIIPMLSEVALGIWLLLRGKNIQKSVI